MDKPASLDQRFIGLNADLDQTLRRYDEMSIYYPSGNGLEYYIEKGSKKSSYIFNYYHGRNILRLNDLVSKSKWRFVPVDNYFRIKTYTDYPPKPEIQLTIGGEGNTGLTRNEIYILAALHEIGHAKFMEIQHQILLKYLNGNPKQTLPEIVLQSEIGYIPLGKNSRMKIVEKEYAWLHNMPNMPYDEQLIQARRLFNNMYLGDPVYFEERFAWAYAFRILRKHKLLNQFNLNDFRHFYIPSLMSYGPQFVKRKDKMSYFHKWEDLGSFFDNRTSGPPLIKSHGECSKV